MKKKISLLLLTILVFVININGVSADNSFSGETLPACGFDYMPAKLPDFTSGLYNVIKLLVPILLIIMGMIDFTKAVMASDEKKMKESQKKFINRLIAGVVVFLIMAVVQFVFKQIDTTTEYKNGFANCINCILNGSRSACEKGSQGERINSCYGYSLDTCDGKKDSSGVTCEEYANSCRPKCSSITAMSTCGNEDHCTWSGPPTNGSCSNK